MTAPSTSDAHLFALEDAAWDRIYVSRDAARFHALMTGDAAAYRSPSEADFDLALMLARGFGDDAAKIHDLMTASGLKRAKWSAHRTYLAGTIRRAIRRAAALGPYPQPSPRQLDAWDARPTPREEIAAAGPPPFRLLTPAELEDPSLLQTPEALSPWLAWRGELSLLVGREKLAGKSTLAASDAARSGRRFLWLSAEESRGRVVKRLADLRVPYDRMLVPDRWPRSWGEVEALVAEAQPDIVYVDSLASFLMAVDGRVPDTSEGEAWQAKVLRFKAWAERGAGAVVALLHATKADGTYRGSTGIGAAPDTIVTMREVDGDAASRRLETIGRWGFPSRGVRFAGDAAGYEDAAVGRPSEADENAAAVVGSYVPGIKAKDWQAASGLPETTFYRARKAAMEERQDGTWGVRRRPDF